MEKTAKQLVNLISSANPEFTELQLIKMEYGLHCFFCEITKFIPYLIIFYFFKVHIYFFIAVIFLSPLRAVTGGYHAKNYWSCFCLSLLIFAVIIYFGKTTALNSGEILGILSVSFILILSFSPVDNENKRIKNKERKMSLKRYGLIMLVLQGGLLYFIPLKYMSTAAISIAAALLLMMVGYLQHFKKS
ncbi:MAG: accessory gene regulator B family protein [Solirubrobacterales bacterium]